MSGLGVPREPMKLVGGSGDLFWREKARMKNKKGKDVSELVRQGAEAALTCLKRAEVESFVFMEGSPSCGIYRTTLKNKRLGKPPGVFGSLLLKEELFLIPAIDLESPLKWWDWRRRLHAFVWLKRFKIKTKKEIYDVWHRYKFLAQEVDRVGADKIGRELAEIPKKISPDVLSEIKKKILMLLRKPTEFPRLKNAFQRQMSFLCKRYGVCFPEKIPK